MFKMYQAKVTRNHLYKQVAEQLQMLIVEQKLKLGDQLAAERDLATEFGVSRTAIREATKILCERGLVQVDPGRGTFVVRPNVDSVAESIGLFVRMRGNPFAQLMEVRRTLEVEIAGLAAERAQATNLECMRLAIERMDANIEVPEVYIEADHDFHQALAEAAQNEIFSLFTRSIVNLVQESRRLVMSKTESGPAHGQYYHYLIFECVRRRDKQGAREAMLKHIEQVETDMAATHETRPALDPPLQPSGVDPRETQVRETP